MFQREFNKEVKKNKKKKQQDKFITPLRRLYMHTEDWKLSLSSLSECESENVPLILKSLL